MATLIDANKVTYQCSCKRLKPLSSLYFCKYCEWLTLKCKDCVFHEIDQKYFCPNCFDNKVLKEVMALKYKCSNCYSCPSCKNLLMIRASTAKNKELIAAAAAAQAAAAAATAAQQQDSAKPTTPSTPSDGSSTTQTPQQLPKVFYLMCGFCRWSTRDAGIPDALSTPGGWKLPENPHAKRIKELADAYQIIAQREKLERERKRYATTKGGRRFHLAPSSSTTTTTSSTGGGIMPASTALLADKYGILGPIRKAQTASAGAAASKIDLQTPIDQYLKSLVQAGDTVDAFEPLSEDVYTKEVNISSITSITQRHANPDFQPTRFNELYPLNKYYLSKESKRCTGCEHNVLKPESNITSIKFKLHQMALFSVPEIRIVAIPEWKSNEPNEIILSVTNRCDFDVNVSFRPEIGSENASKTNATLTFGRDGKSSSDGGETATVRIDRLDNAKSQAASVSTTQMDSDGLVCFKRDNKIAILARLVLANPDLVVKTNENVLCAFRIKFSNANVMPSGVPIASTTDPNSSTTSPTTTTAAAAVAAASSPSMQTTAQAAVSPQEVRVCLDLGPFESVKCVPIPKYVEECLNKKT